MNEYQPQLAPQPEDYCGKLPVSEVFHSIQGEGRWRGTPSVFIRLQYCNLGCYWCDTRYAWETGEINKGTLYSPESLAQQVTSLTNYPAVLPHIVLTGGEPLLHQDRIPALLELLRRAGFGFIEIETNGSIILGNELLTAVDWWNCSPKLRNSRVSEELRINPTAIRTLALSGKADFKFVVRDRNDVEEIGNSYGKWIDAEQIWLMPEGQSRDIQSSRMKDVVELSLAKGYRFTPRLQVLIWDNERSR
ncbi:7-carboxy-7-deazaguanine synthase QueE [bacterium]|nr:7-carboxy-7-deazaguanine synthase QueE [bacterium]